MNPYFNGTITKGKLVINNQEQFDLYISNFEGKEVQVMVRKYYFNRTIPQNSYLWVLNTIVGNELGYTPEEMHEIFKFMFLKIEKNGLEFVRSTSSLNTSEMKEYIEKNKGLVSTRASDCSS